MTLPFIDRTGPALTFRALAATIRIGFPVLAAGSTRT